GTALKVNPTKCGSSHLLTTGLYLLISNASLILQQTTQARFLQKRPYSFPFAVTTLRWQWKIFQYCFVASLSFFRFETLISSKVLFWEINLRVARPLIAFMFCKSVPLPCTKMEFFPFRGIWEVVRLCANLLKLFPLWDAFCPTCMAISFCWIRLHEWRPRLLFFRRS